MPLIGGVTSAYLLCLLGSLLRRRGSRLRLAHSQLAAAMQIPQTERKQDGQDIEQESEARLGFELSWQQSIDEDHGQIASQVGGMIDRIARLVPDGEQIGGHGQPANQKQGHGKQRFKRQGERGQKDAERDESCDGSRGTQGRNILTGQSLREQRDERGGKGCDSVRKQQSQRTNKLLDDAPEHKQRQHVGQ